MASDARSFMQTPTEFDEFCLVMEEWYAKELGPAVPKILETSLVFHVYQSAAICLLSGGKAGSKLDFVLMALEQAGIPPLGGLQRPL